nr:unnamed protein product [Digitaria exilis]
MSVQEKSSRAGIASNRPRASATRPWSEYAAITAFQETAFLPGIPSKTARASSTRPCRASPESMALRRAAASCPDRARRVSSWLLRNTTEVAAAAVTLAAPAAVMRRDGIERRRR